MPNLRVTAEQVKEIIDTSITDTVIENNHLVTAHIIVDTHLPTATSGHSESVLEQIELYLAAHFVALTEERGSLKGQKYGDASEFLESSHLGSGFRSTRYGEMALTLDTTGILANMSAASSRLKAEFRVIESV